LAPALDALRQAIDIDQRGVDFRQQAIGRITSATSRNAGWRKR
jgi:hypothetical protein